MGFEQPKFLKKLVNIAALSAALVGGELKAKDTTQPHPDNKQPVATKTESKLANAKKIKEIRNKLGVPEIRVESDTDDSGRKWNTEDAKRFQQLREEEFFGGASERQIAGALKKEIELKKTGLIQETDRDLLAKAHPDEHRTPSSGWAHNVVFYAKDLQETARDREDVVNLINKSYDAFVVRFNNPDITLGDSVNESRVGGKLTDSDRTGSKADFKSMAENATELGKIIQKVAAQHGIEEANISIKIRTLEEISRKCLERVK